MTSDEKRLLVRQAVKLTALGITVERERERLKKFVERGVPYTAPEILVTLEKFENADSEWKRLEVEHLALKRDLQIALNRIFGFFNRRVIG